MRKNALYALKTLIAFAFVGGLYWWIDTHLDWKEVLFAWRNVSLQQLILVIFAVFFSHFLRCYRVFYTFKLNHSLRLSQVSGVSLLHNTVSFLLPMRLGEAALPLLSRQQLGVGIAYSSASLVLLRIFDANWLLILLVVFAGTSLLIGSAQLIAWLLIIMTPIALFALIVVIKKLNKFKSIQSLVDKPSSLIIIYLITGVTWVSKLAALAYAASVLGALPVDHAWIATIIADASALSPITGFANAGTFEAAFSLPLLPLGYESQSLVKIALNLHILNFIDQYSCRRHWLCSC